MIGQLAVKYASCSGFQRVPCGYLGGVKLATAHQRGKLEGFEAAAMEADDVKCKSGQYDFRLDKDFKIFAITRD